MLLANSCVREAAKTARVCRIRHAPLAVSLYSLFIQKHYAKSGTFGFSERTPEVLTNLLWEVRFFVGNGEGIEVLAEPIFVRAQPFNGSGTAARPRSSSKSIAPNREPLVFGTNSESINEPLMGDSFFCGERGGDRSIGEANLRKGAALQWLAHLAPVRGVSSFNGWRPCRGSALCADPRPLLSIKGLNY